MLGRAPILFSTLRGSNAAGIASATTVRAYSPVSLMDTPDGSAGGLLSPSAAFSLPEMCLTVYLNCYMYNIHLLILADGGLIEDQE